jgi:hypothetical protein
VVQGGGVLLLWLNFIKVFDTTVDTIENRFTKTLYFGFTGRS